MSPADCIAYNTSLRNLEPTWSTWRKCLAACLLALIGSTSLATEKPAAAAAVPTPQNVNNPVKAASVNSTPSPGAVTPPVAARDALSDKRLNPRVPATSDTDAQDPMDRLQQRLAERLGARMAKSEATPEGELRLVARPAAGEQAKSTRAGSNALSGGKAARTLAGYAPAGWAYDGPAGPEHWARLKPEFAACGKGERQSPIDIRDGIKVQLDAIKFNYQAPEFRVIDNGYTVRANVAAGSFIEVMGRRYELTHLQFHRPSEVRVNGKAFDMSAHLVHRDAQGRSAIVVVLLERGSAHPLVQTVWNNLPLEKGVEAPASAPLDLFSLLPEDQRYTTFMGSMTTPPCEEGVLWMVMKTPAQLSDYQLAVFTQLYPMNARPIQPRHGRLIKESE